MEHTDPTEHPRPLLRRPWTPLDGEWEFAADPDLVGTVGGGAIEQAVLEVGGELAVEFGAQPSPRRWRTRVPRPVVPLQGARPAGGSPGWRATRSVLSRGGGVCTPSA